MTTKEMSSSARAIFDRDLKSLQADVLQMGAMLDSAMSGSLTALRECDVILGQEIVDRDAEVNALRYKIEKACLRMIATQQPAASDLRAIVAAMNMAGDMERIGDHAAGISKVLLRMDSQGEVELPASLTLMADVAMVMLRRALEAYNKADDKLAYEVASKDDLIDEHYHALYAELVELMTRNPGKTTTGVYLMFVGHNIERIADRATNLAENVIFMTSGKIQELNPESGIADAN